MPHKFKIGQSVHFTSNVLRGLGATGLFQVVKLMPPEGDDLQYRIKSSTEPYDRVVKESQLDRDAMADGPSGATA